MSLSLDWNMYVTFTVFLSALRVTFFSGKRFEVAVTVRPFAGAAVVGSTVVGSATVVGSTVVGSAVVGSATVVGSASVTMSTLPFAPCFVA